MDTKSSGGFSILEKNTILKKYERIKLLIKNIQEAPVTGIGKPEPLKHILSGLWSRRINHEHRLIYSVNTKQIIIYNCRFHYKN